MNSLNEYQSAARRTATTQHWAGGLDGVVPAMGSALGLTGEAGEVADTIKKVVRHGHPFDRDLLQMELGDVLWYVAELSSILGLTLQEVAQSNVDKLRRRYPDGFSSERSVNRDGG